MNEFIAMLMNNFSGYLGFNEFLVVGYSMFFIFGLIYVLGLPRYLTIPAALVAVFVIIGFGAWIGFLLTTALGLGLGFLLWMMLR